MISDLQSKITVTVWHGFTSVQSILTTVCDHANHVDSKPAESQSLFEIHRELQYRRRDYDRNGRNRLST